jgi:CRISPR-associated exonuclease Cas4
MTIGLWWSAVAAVAVLVAAFVLRRRRHAAGEAAEAASRPAALRGATLAYMEKQFRVRAPIPLVARLDRAYRRVDGELVLVELKTRWSNRAYSTDVIQLSVQKMVLEGLTRQRVATHGFVNVKMPGDDAVARSHRVELIDSSTIVALYHRREDIISGRTVPRYADSGRACGSCAFRSQCDCSTR